MGIAVGTPADFPPGQMRVLDAGGRSVGVYNTGTQLLAVLNVCPHQLAPVCEGTVSGTLLPSRPGELVYGLDNLVLRCPWHGWEFDLRTGETLFRHDRRHLRPVAVSIQDGLVILDLRAREQSGEVAATS